MRALQLTLDMSQRWLFGKPKYRPSREIIRPTDFDVAEIPDDTTARNFTREHHYSGSRGAARVRVGLYRQGALVGVAVFSHPCSDAVLTRSFSVPTASAVELGGFVLLNAAGDLARRSSRGLAHLPLPTIQTSAECG